MAKLELEMLPAAEGDALLLTYGESDELRYILVDGGRRNTYKALRDHILSLPSSADGKRVFELLIVSHIDADHIEGIICLLQDDELGCEFKDIWFNDFVHLEPLEEGTTPTHLGAGQGEFLGALLHERGLRWNHAFSGGAVVLPEAPEPLTEVALDGGLTLTVVSPSVESLIKLRRKWAKVIDAAGFTPGDRDNALQQFADKRWVNLPQNLGDENVRRTLDHSEANGSSIGVIAQYEGVRLLLSGDAWAQVLRPALERWRDQNEPGAPRARLDAFKLPHHGSKNNLTPQLMSVIDCPRYLVSSSGSRFHHPDVEAIKMIIEHHHGEEKPQLHFNYTSDDNEFWAKNAKVTTHYEADARLSFTFDS